MSVFTALNNIKKQRKLTLHHMGKFFISELTGIKFKIWRVTFFKSFYHLKILGWTSDFHQIDDLPCAHWDETDFREQSWPCCKVGQGHPKKIIWTNFVGPESLMLYAKFEVISLLISEKKIFKGFLPYMCMVAVLMTRTIWTNFHCYNP